MTFEAIGQKLKSAREAQGLSLRQIYERTKIPINHLQALDSGQPDDLPEPVYVAGFIKRYAECIGLDGQILADEYRRLDNGNGNGQPKQVSPPVYVTQDYLRHTRIDNRAPSYKLWPFYAGIIVLFMGVLSWYSSQLSNNNQSGDTTASLKDSLSHVEQQTPAGNALQPGQTQATTAAPGSTPAAGAQGTANPAGNGNSDQTGTTADGDNLKLSASKHVWIEVKRLDSGATLFTGFLEPGAPKVFENSKGLRVLAGNGGSLSAEFKGKIETFGVDGKRTERVFSGTNTAAEATALRNHAITAEAPASTTAAVAGSTAQSTQSKPKKPAHKADSQTTARRWTGDESGTRSIPGEDGMRSIDVPYRYSEGRLDNN